MLKRIPSDKISSTNNALFFLSRAPIHYSFTFNLRFLYELKHQVRLSKTVCRIFVFIKVYIFVQQNAWTLVIIPFKMKINRKATQFFAPRSLISCKKKF